VREQFDRSKLGIKKIIIASVLTISLSNLQSPVWAADGDLDTSFDTDGIQTTSIGSVQDIAYSVAIQSDGKIVAAGYSHNGSNNDFAVVRYSTDGSLDTTFGTAGKVITAIGSGTDVANYVVVQSDGKIVAAGYSHNGSNVDFAVVRYNTDGSLDTSFGTGGKVTTAVGSSNDTGRSVVMQSDGKIIVVGSSENLTDTDFAVVRYNTNGSLDTTFSGDGKVTTAIGSGNDGANSVVLQSDGKIVVAGVSFETFEVFAVVRYTSTGSEDATFSGDGKVTTAVGSSQDQARSVVLQSDGKIVAAGFSDNGSNYDFAVVRYNSDGSLDTTFSGDGIVTTAVGAGSDYGYSVAMQSDGKIVAAGYSYSGTKYDFAVVRYTISVSSLSWVGAQSISCPAPNPWVKEKLGFASNVKPVLVSAENTIGKTITQSAYDALKSSGVEFDTVSTKVSTATEKLPIYGCKDKLLSGKLNQPIQFIAGGYTLQSNAHGYINTADLKWHDTNSVTLYTNTAAFMHTIKFTKKGKYVVVLTEQPDTSRGLIPTYGVRSIRFVININ